jgi:glycosyltransferase involved in cell wall biosynthesis
VITNKLLIVSDAWHPQVNGVVRTIENTIKCLEQRGWEVKVISPLDFPNFPMPGYAEIAISYKVKKKLTQLIDDFCPDYIHLAVEGPIGIAARRYCLDKNYKFTTAYHTKFPEFVEARLGLSARMIYPFFRWFHAPSANVMTAIPTLARELTEHGFKNEFGTWSRGVDLELFSPERRVEQESEFALYVGRVSHEKNIIAFLEAETELRKVVVGDGPQLEELRSKFPDVEFVGTKSGVELATYYASARVFVFPSKTDTFGLVMIEALASGTPVAAFNVPSPSDVITEEVGALSDDLSEAIKIASTKDQDDCYYFVKRHYTWERATEQFIKNLVSTM